MPTIRIRNDIVSPESDAWVIAEVGHNHQGSVEKCKQIFRAAQECGVNAVKLQKRHNRTLYTRDAFNEPYNSENAFGATYGEHREALEFGWDEYRELKRYAEDELGLIFFATAFDFKSADFLAELDIPVFKIASGDLKSTPLLEHVARFQKPMIVSTGGATLEDVRRAYDTIMPINSQLAILQCTAAYPAEPEEMNLRVIETFQREFPGAIAGISDHQNGVALATIAYVLGARVIEKHFTLNRAWKGTDHAFSLEPVGMKKLTRDLKRARVALGDGVKAPLPNERKPLVKMGKKLVAARALPAGHRLERADVAMKSPGDGLPPYELTRVVGRTLKRPVVEDEAFVFENLD
jgi:sialic acid synthase